MILPCGFHAIEATCTFRPTLFLPSFCHHACQICFGNPCHADRQRKFVQSGLVSVQLRNIGRPAGLDGTPTESLKDSSFCRFLLYATAEEANVKP